MNMTTYHKVLRNLKGLPPKPFRFRQIKATPGTAGVYANYFYDQVINGRIAGVNVLGQDAYSVIYDKK